MNEYSLRHGWCKNVHQSSLDFRPPIPRLPHCPSSCYELCSANKQEKIAFSVRKWRGGNKVEGKKVRKERKRAPLKVANMRKSSECRNAYIARKVAFLHQDYATYRRRSHPGCAGNNETVNQSNIGSTFQESRYF